ncbi:MAG: hypothetical protein ACXQTO_02060 [Candidatus Syntropharchaeales archaeon]
MSDAGVEGAAAPLAEDDSAPSAINGIRKRILEPTMMLWRNWNAAFRIAMNEIAVNAVTELAARNIRKSAAFCGDFRRWSSGEKISTPAMNITPKMTAKKVVMSADVLKILLLSLPGKKRMIEKSSPNLGV